MRLRFLSLLCASTFCLAQPSTPTFTAASVLPADGKRPVPLAPGLTMSIYGAHLGPLTACHGYLDAQSRETPNPGSSRQIWSQLLVYSKTLCDTQVLVGGVPAGLLYVQDRQINFKVPQQISLEGKVSVEVIYRGRPGASVTLPASQDFVAVYLESVAKVGGPVWLKVFVPGWKGAVSYPFGIRPASLGCMEVEVRRDGKPLSKLAEQWQTTTAIGGMGNPCSSLGLPAQLQHTDRVPLHLQYRFEQPGAYEVRITARDAPSPNAAIRFRSPWTQIEIQPGTPADRSRWLRQTATQAPTDAVNLLTDYLPSILGIPDAPSLALLCRYLYHPDAQVRRFAMSGLAYWTQPVAEEAVLKAVRSRGPSDMAVQVLIRPGTLEAHADAMVEAAIPNLQSDSAVLLDGSVTALYRIALSKDSHVNPALRTRAEAALFAAENRVINAKDPQILTNYACALGVAHDNRSRVILWHLVYRNAAREQALIALTWRHHPEDLPIIADFVLSTEDDRYDRSFSSTPYALHSGYGDASVPYLEAMLERSQNVGVRSQSARELVQAGRPAGFAFILDAMENATSYRGEMIQFLRDRFPELHQADDAALLTFLKSHAVAK